MRILKAPLLERKQVKPPADGTKTALGLAAHARAQIGQLYWYGTFGQAPTLQLLNQKHAQYPAQMTTERYDYAKKYHVGKAKLCFDCAGLIKSYWMMRSPTALPNYIAAYDKSAAGLKAACKATGKMATMPEEPGLLVFIGTGHVGVYLGNGSVAEARGFSYGVVETKLKNRPWDAWGRLSWLEQKEEENEHSRMDAPTCQCVGVCPLCGKRCTGLMAA